MATAFTSTGEQHIVDVMNMTDAQPALRDLVVALLHKLNDTEEPT